jgi:hypothetical protein
LTKHPQLLDTTAVSRELREAGAPEITPGEIADLDRVVSAWLSEHWSEIRDGALPGLRELAIHLRSIWYKP